MDYVFKVNNLLEDYLADEVYKISKQTNDTYRVLWGWCLNQLIPSDADDAATLKGNHESRCMAIKYENITQDILHQLVLTDTNTKVRVEAVNHITRQYILEKIVQRPGPQKIKIIAYTKITDPGFLEKQLTRPNPETIRKVIIDRLKNLKT